MQELYEKLEKKCSLEKEFTTNWLSILKKKWYWTHKISDWWIGLKPFDGMIVTYENTFFFEAKKITNDIFSIESIRQNQWTAMSRVSKLTQRTKCIIVIFSVAHNDYIIIPFDEIEKLWYFSKIKINFEEKKYELKLK